jgi:hypothetical protein
MVKNKEKKGNFFGITAIIFSKEKSRGLYFDSESTFIPPLQKLYLSPSRDLSFFDPYCALFALIPPYFAFISPFYFPLVFLFPLSSIFPLSSFFSYIFLFSLPMSFFFPPMISADIPPQGGYFSIYRSMEKRAVLLF